ncbi:MAG: rRNA maturation RNase YbeY [Burkholderiales bacterium]|jgi:probable rRNA maturation factor|nr:rRNA maturation RNase YbeY [Burkholderiales bacterium]
MQAPHPAAPLLQLSVQFASSAHRSALPRHKLQRWVRAALRCGPADAHVRKAKPAAVEPAHITLRFVDAAESRELNRAYRGKDYATNVLTFDYQPWPPAADIVLCDAVIAREATEQGKDLAAHYAHMVVHGVLHAMGWDHAQDADAERMEAAERALLLTLGITDPYA